ncbi:MAG: hypothetical protein E7371_05050 [Clostridiales bacterium]|nr:hypothetical protein [Clostridiales bacterium]
MMIENKRKDGGVMSKKRTKAEIGKVNPFLYSIFYRVLKPRYTRKYNIKYDNAIVKDIKGPAIVVATHTCDEDHILSGLTLYPVRPTYIVSQHLIHEKANAKLLKMMHVITKKMFSADVSTIRNIMRAKNENAVLVIFPEGRLSCYGHTLPVTDGTAELIKKLGVNLYIWKAEGAYLTFPKWREKGDTRKGQINASVKLLLSAEEVAQKGVDEIREITANAILHDDELAMEGVEYRGKHMALGVDKILFKCPKCLQENTITSEGDHIRCSCGLDATLDKYYRLHDAPFSRINEWFEWQQNSIDIDNETLSTKVRIGTCKEDGFMDLDAGTGEIYMDKDVFKLSGTVHGESIDFTVKTENIGAFPITPGSHIDIYHEGKLFTMCPEPIGKVSVKWVCFVDKFNEMRKKKKEI